MEATRRVKSGMITEEASTKGWKSEPVRGALRPRSYTESLKNKQVGISSDFSA